MRFAPHPGMGFPASELKTVEYDEDDDSKPRSSARPSWGCTASILRCRPRIDDITQRREGHERRCRAFGYLQPSHPDTVLSHLAQIILLPGHVRNLRRDRQPLAVTVGVWWAGHTRHRRTYRHASVTLSSLLGCSSPKPRGYAGSGAVAGADTTVHLSPLPPAALEVG